VAKAGDLISSPPTGERIQFAETSKDTGGELLRFEYWQEPGGAVPAVHLHPQQQETFHVRAGRPRFTIRGEIRDAAPGETLVVPPGTPHVFGNPTDAQVHVTIELRPALRSEDMFVALYTLAAQGRLTRVGIPTNPLLGALFARQFRNEVRPVGWMRALATLTPPAASVARLFGMSLPVGGPG
jgi:quercetin dioxygenase-like cupin family protein